MYDGLVMRTRSILALALLAGCTPSPAPGPPANVTTSTARVEAPPPPPPPPPSATPPADPSPPPPASCGRHHLYDLVQEVQRKVHELPEAEAKSALGAFGDALVSDPCVSDRELVAEKERFDRTNASLHAG